MLLKDFAISVLFMLYKIIRLSFLYLGCNKSLLIKDRLMVIKLGYLQSDFLYFCTLLCLNEVFDVKSIVRLLYKFNSVSGSVIRANFMSD